MSVQQSHVERFGGSSLDCRQQRCVLERRSTVLGEWGATCKDLGQTHTHTHLEPSRCPYGGAPRPCEPMRHGSCAEARRLHFVRTARRKLASHRSRPEAVVAELSLWGAALGLENIPRSERHIARMGGSLGTMRSERAHLAGWATKFELGPLRACGGAETKGVSAGGMVKRAREISICAIGCKYRSQSRVSSA